MVTFDSVKLKFPAFDAELQSQFFLTKEISDDSGYVVSQQTILNQRLNKQIGVKNVVLSADDILVECSAKILQDDYLSGINKNNIERVLVAVSPFVNIPDFTDCELLRGDCTTNIQVDNVRDSISALRLGKSNTGYKVDDYRTAKNNGIVFQGRQVSQKHRQIYYNKGVEIQLSRNKDFIESLAQPAKFLDSVRPILRVEQNISQKKAVRTRFGTCDNQFLNILESKENPLLTKHRDIMRFAQQVPLFDEISSYESAKQFIWARGYLGIIELCNNSLELAEDVIMSRAGEAGFAYSTLRRYVKEMKTVYSATLAACKKGNESRYFNELERIENALENI